MGMVLLIDYHKKPIAIGSIIKRCNFNETKKKKKKKKNVKGKLLHKTCDNWADGQSYGLSRI